MHKTLVTLQHFQRAVPSKHFIFSKGAPVPWHSGQSKPAYWSCQLRSTSRGPVSNEMQLRRRTDYNNQM